MSKRIKTTRAFTLIELLVAVAIIALLLGIGVVGMSALYKEGDKSRTQIMLRQLQGVLTEYGAHTGGSLPAGNRPIAEVIGDIKTNGGEAAERMLRSVERQFWDGGRYNGSTADQRVNDGWDNAVVYFLPAGTNTAVANTNQQPKRPQPYFASSGPDGQWGEFTDGNLGAPNAAARDNLFSFEVGQ